MPWIYLVVAGFLEIVWAYTMKQSHGFSRLTPSLITIVTMAASFWLLSLSMRSIPLGTAYVIWTGIGAVMTLATGVVMYHDKLDRLKILFVFLIIAGVIGLEMSSEVVL